MQANSHLLRKLIRVQVCPEEGRLTTWNLI
jgi:hypothetical protein